jgi:hypothetical protein
MSITIYKLRGVSIFNALIKNKSYIFVTFQSILFFKYALLFFTKRFSLYLNFLDFRFVDCILERIYSICLLIIILFYIFLECVLFLSYFSIFCYYSLFYFIIQTTDLTYNKAILLFLFVLSFFLSFLIEANTFICFITYTQLLV